MSDDENQTLINNAQYDDSQENIIRTKQTINEGKNIILMKKGDYSIHILIEEVKSLIQISDSHLPKPIIKLTCFGQSKRTEKTKLPCDSYIFDEHFYFEKADLTVEQLDSSKILIEVYDSSRSSKRKDYFGIYEFDIEYIYSMKNHCLKNHWLALSNPESNDMTKIRGYLKLSISVLHDEDPRVELRTDTQSLNCLIPSEIKIEYKQLSIYLIKAEELPDMDYIIKKKAKNRECDPFVQIEYFGQKIRSKITKNKNDAAYWNQIINLPIQMPLVNNKIILLVKDHDTLGNNDNIGSYEININDIIGPVNKYSNYRYIDIYGAVKNKKNKICDLMNTNAEIGSAWNGRILLKILYKNSDNPMINTEDIKDNKELNLANSVKRSILWTIHTKLYCAYYLPKEYKKYSIKICLQDSNVIYPAKNTINEYIEWKSVKTMQFLNTSEDKEILPDIFFYLINKDDEQVCFQRINAAHFHLNEQIMIIKLLPEPCCGKIKSNINTGLLKIKISLFNNKNEKNKIDMNKFRDGETEEEPSEEDMEKINLDNIGFQGGKIKDLYTVVCVVYMCRYLISTDSNGNNDPYVRITCIDTKRETSIKHGTINGIWNETLIFDGVNLNLKKKSTWPILLTEILDYDKIGKNDLLGSSFIWLSDSPCRLNDTKMIKPKWHQLYLPKSNSPQGEILLSFYIFDKNNRNKFREINPVPETILYSLDINILGLRDIKPLSMLPIKKAYIKFDMNSLNISGNKEDTLQPRITQPKDKGSNPTINSAIKLDLKLPKEEIFMPQLQCEVCDYIFSGLMNPTLGLFLLNIKSIIEETNKQIQEDEKITKDKLGFYLTKGMITNQQGALGDIDNVNEINTSTKQIKINNINTNINNDDNMLPVNKKLIEENEIKVYTKHYDVAFIERNKNNSEYFVVLPQYNKYFIPGSKQHKGNNTPYLIESESMAPSRDYYLPIGYIPKPERKLDDNNIVNHNINNINQNDGNKIIDIKKHYRRYFNTELENVEELNIKSPFYTAYLRRGKDKDKKDETAIFTALSDINSKIIKRYDPKDENKPYEEKKQENAEGDNNNIVLPKNFIDRGYGKFKAVIRICEKEKMLNFQKSLEKFRAKDEKIISELKNVEKYEKLTKSILIKHEVLIRVYILELRDLPKKDLLSDSDPYIKIYLGEEKKYDEAKFYQKNKKNVKWYKYYEIQSIFPGDSTLRIEVWDHNSVFSDELIGFTSLDLEDRYFNNDWQQMKFKPIETRPIINPDLSGQQGNILLWVEIFNKKNSINMSPWQISPEPKDKVELRLIIWETEEMKMMDVEDTSDIYVTAFFDKNEKQSTDVHYRCQTGNASFNWRIVMQLDVPRINYRLNIHCYDKDIFSKDDFISGAIIDLSDLIKIPKNLDAPITLSKEYMEAVTVEEKRKYENLEFLVDEDDKTLNKFWVQCYQNNQKSGRILCSLEILPMWKAEINKVGKGRKEPNINPYLPPPVGRFQWTWNPFKLFNQCVGPRFRKKLYCTICMICIVIYLMFLIPYMIYHLSGQLVNPFNYTKKKKKKS